MRVVMQPVGWLIAAVELRGFYMGRRRCTEYRTSSSSVSLTVCLLALCCCARSSGSDLPVEEPVALLTDGRSVASRLRGIADNGDWIFNQAGQTVTVARDALVTWGAYRDRCSRSWILLNDGSLLVADLLGIEPDEIVIAGRVWPETRLPRSLVRAIVFRPPLESRARDALVFRALSELRAEDRLLLEHGDELRGVAPERVLPEPGAFHPENIRWPIRGTLEPIELSLQRTTALLFAADRQVPGATSAGAVQWIGLSDGSRLLATGVVSTENRLEFALLGGAKLTTDAVGGQGVDPYNEVVFLQPFGTGVAYLSDREPIGYKHIPFLASSWPYLDDRSVSGGQLRFGDQLLLKGVGMHSSSRLAYDLDEQYHEVQAELAIDQRAGRSGSVIYRLYVQDGAGQWTKAFESPVVRGGQHPVPMRVDVRKAFRIALIVDFADRADQWDHANWLNVRLVR